MKTTAQLSGVERRLAPLAAPLASVIHIAILAAIGLLAFFIRVFSVIKYESIIHEFDPWFNFRASQFLLANGRKEFAVWFDTDAWYPLGRLVGTTVFPGLMYTTVVLEGLLRALRLPVDIRHVCVFTAPVFSVVSAVGTYLMAWEVCGDRGAGLLSALFMAVAPSYLSRSVAGSFDNEAIAITLLLMTLYLFLKAMHRSSILWSTVCGLTFGYLVSSWGGYHFVVLFIPTFVLSMIVIQRFDTRLYVAYNVFYAVGTFCAMQTRSVELQALRASEHFLSHVAFVATQAMMVYEYLRARLSPAQMRFALRRGLAVAAAVGFAGAAFIVLTGRIAFSPRVLSLLDPSYAPTHVPIIASVSEHQPTPWASFFFDFHFLLIFAPIGMFYALRRARPATLFVALYAVSCVYLAGLMVRLVLVLAPAVCVLAGVGVSKLLRKAARGVQRSSAPRALIRSALAVLLTVVLGALVARYVFHSTIIGAEVYSSPSVVLSNRDYNSGTKVIIDDFREAYYWLRQNTPERSKVMSWWDYGYQIAGFSNRTTICDNNTWNFTHIATVGKIFSSDEEEGYPLLEELGVDYVLVTFGGKSGYNGDDINKFLWIIRIAGNTYPSVKEADFLNNGYRIDENITPAFRNSLMYKLNYYRFWEEDGGYGKGYDVVRRARIGHTHYKLKYFEEVFTSQRWLVRIYKRKSKTNRQEVGFLPTGWEAHPDAYDPVAHSAAADNLF